MTETMETLRFLPSGTADGFCNMATDEVLLEECRSGAIAGALRVYQWDPPAVSLGRAQSVDLIDIQACEDAGVNVVRRVTGGGAVLHWEEITYCLVARRELLGETLWPRQFAGLVAAAVADALVELRVPASVLSGRSGGSVDEETSPLCFSAGMENEVGVNGRKLAGCAHKFTAEAYLSHGSIMLGRSHMRIAELLRSEAPGADLKGLREGCISLSELMESLPSPERAGRALRGGFERRLCLAFVGGQLSGIEQKLIQEGTVEKRGIRGRTEKSHV
jgi:lipoate-protein ligase A